MTQQTSAMKRALDEYRLSRYLRCWLCGQRIDCGLPVGDPDGVSVDHVKPQSTHPHLVNDPDNFRPAHLRCNKARGNRAPGLDLGPGGDVW